MDRYSQPVRRVLGFQFAVFLVVCVVLFHLSSPADCFGADHDKGDRGRVQRVMLLPPPPFDLGLLFAKTRIKVEYQDRRQVRHHDNEGAARLRYTILQAAEAVERGNLRKARRILARAQRELRKAELGYVQYERRPRGHQREKEYVYYGTGGDECRF